MDSRFAGMTFDQIFEKLEHGTIEERAAAKIIECITTEGTHHKTWYADQALRILAGNAYAHIVKAFEAEDDEGMSYEWDCGIPA